jgi:hypothetical protein
MFTRRSSSPYRRDFFVFALVRNSTFSATVPVFLGQEHLDTSTRPSLLKEGKIESVRYELGRRFFSAPEAKRNKEENFALEVSAYRPMLCVAEVTFNNGISPCTSAAISTSR